MYYTSDTSDSTLSPDSKVVCLEIIQDDHMPRLVEVLMDMENSNTQVTIKLCCVRLQK